MSGVPAVEFRQVSYAYPGMPEANAVHDMSFSIACGEFVAVVGSNGAGKTTLSKLMNGLIKPDSGNVLVDGEDTAAMSASALAQRVGMLFQNPDHQICQQSVVKEIAFTLGIRGGSPSSIDDRAREVALEYDLDPDADPFTLPRSQRQRLALASTVVGDPATLILDEPTNGLDGRSCRRIMERIRKLHTAGTTVIAITHDMELAFDNAQRILAMSAGQLVADGTPESVFRNAAVLDEASLHAPQIIDLSERMAAAGGVGGLLAHASSVADMMAVMRSAGLSQQEERSAR
jgi:energy-coupling factor transporter ATP-binding protein EcfA2